MREKSPATACSCVSLARLLMSCNRASVSSSDHKARLGHGLGLVATLQFPIDNLTSKLAVEVDGAHYNRQASQHEVAK